MPKAKSQWKKKKLGEALTLNYGKGLPKRDRKDGQYPVYGSSGIVDHHDDYLVEGPGIIVGRKGSVGETYYEQSSYYPIDTVYYITEEDEYNLNYLYYLLSKIDFKSLNSDSAVPGLNREVAYSQEINLPPLKTQKKIADVLSTYDELIENNTRRIKILEEMAQAIYQEWFVNFRFPGHEKVKMVDSGTEFGKIPEGWERVSMRQITEYYIGGGWGKEEWERENPKPAYVIRGTDIPRAKEGNVDECPLRHHKESNLNSRKLYDGDMIFEVSGGSKGQPLGRSLLVLSSLLARFDYDVICASFCKLIRIKKEIVSPYIVSLQVMQWRNSGVLEQYQTQSTGISNFKFETFLDKQTILLAPQKIQRKFDELGSRLYNEAYALGNINQKLRQARDLLLPELVSGEVEV